MDTDRYLQPHQARRRAPTVFEDLLGDAIERAFAEGAWTLPELVASLNRGGPGASNGEQWTEESFRALMARLGNEGDAA
ncbi:recombinase-like helix-turn-helix domain-containing protein [Ramlibacter alkalitolerans]|jgi:hypothetical protein|uniref:Recombinase-like domain-containing protein n=1 Tax=Ramlibacter alkalitolerans TaxID=2039631 RepID=A0ABS1JJY5_9BURK|nr:recombinase-like helix-turn-helix domain-containing protein [Ramlibacter alkalitolerans]MBL0424544.1 hypothetical protein [Ramlibacter alkalitolerans]